MKVKAGILIDFGNSETRMALLVNNKTKLITLSNKFAALPSGYNVPIEYNNDKSNVICVNGSYYANGALADREFASQLIRPSSMQNKSEQLVTEISLNLVLITAIRELASGSGMTVADIEPSFNISVLLENHIVLLQKNIPSFLFSLRFYFPSMPRSSTSKMSAA